jgi:hypothetical protein
MKRFLIGLVAIVAVAGLAFGTWQVAYAQGQAAGRAAVAAARADFLQGRPGGADGGAGQGPVAGTVDRVNGATLTLTTDAGNVMVMLDERTQVRRLVAADPSDLKAGERVLVTGARAADGTVTAAAIQIQGS